MLNVQPLVETFLRSNPPKTFLTGGTLILCFKNKNFLQGTKMHLRASMSSVGFHNSKNLGCCFQEDGEDEDESDHHDDPDGDFQYMEDIEAELAETHGLKPIQNNVPSKSRDLKQPRIQRPPTATVTPALNRFRMTSTLAKLTPTSEKSSSADHVVLPVSASLPLVASLMNLSMDVSSIQQGTSSLQGAANQMALEEIIHRYQYLSGQILSQNVAMQLLLDLLFVSSTLLFSSPGQTDNEVKVTGLIETFRSRIDPDQFEVLEPYIQERVRSLSEVLPGLSNLLPDDNIGDLIDPDQMDSECDSGVQTHNPLYTATGEEQEQQDREGLCSEAAASSCLSPISPSLPDDASLDLGLDSGEAPLYPPAREEEELCLNQSDGIIVVPDTPYCPHPPSHPEYQLFTYPKPRVKNSVFLRTLDFKTLDKKTWLNCGIINFYTQYLFYEKLSREDQDNVLIYDSEFLLLCSFNDGTEKMIERYQNIKIFEKKFLFFPVCENSHWILIVCVR